MSAEAHYPTGFTEHRPIESFNMDAKFVRPFLDLSDKGLVVVAGIQPEDVAGLTEIAEHEGTREFCPNDIEKRWATEEMTEKQLGKDGGRAVFRLVSRDESELYGFGWTGKSSEEERGFLPECENTFAVRMHPRARGNHLATPFSRTIVIGSMALYGAKRIGLETWGSNTAAVRAYLGAGATLVTTKDDIRPTLRNDQQDFLVKDVPHRRDVRQYMQYGWSF